MRRLTVLRAVPEFARGMPRDLRVRWALREAGLDYEEWVVDRAELGTPTFRRYQPFGQMPVYQEDGLTLFESGAIVLHIAETDEALLPRDLAGRAETFTWMFAALNTVEPPVRTLAEIDFVMTDENERRRRRPEAEQRVRTRFAEVDAVLADREFLCARFSAADILMVTVLRIVAQAGLEADLPALVAYRARCEARPAFQRALQEQIATFDRHAASE
ncbi:glutathione S-transferase family protein [Novosphingobium sp.]|uniref:glutathione S-transferase family protein n=1 Tax=Novosphingobium sp. TaxID=1874826 RepID=UPI0028B02BEA|nr:glutathione S-transferase family protein [Novosphingobium sp.]